MSSKNPIRQMPRYVADTKDYELGAVDAVRVSDRTSNLWLDAWRDVRGRWMFWASAAVILLVIVVALFPTLFTSVPPNDDCFLSNSNGAPEPGHPLGFTKQGCDVFSRIVHGTSTSLSVGLIVSVIVTVIGIVVGAFAGFFGGWLDSLLMRLGDMFFAIPYILAAVVIMSIFLDDRNIWIISLAIGFFAWPATARILRSEVLRVKQSEYVTASTALGLSRARTMFVHVLPNSIAPVIVVTTVGLAAAITAEATLSFLGVGLPNNLYMSWGNDISAAQGDLRTHPMTLIYPSIALSLTVLAFIMLGETVRDALDPKARASR
ncbi:oligopeptide transport system permease protein [Microbacteriaceae bacterium SG_E_30_P1]|uniref:Oligopeptide transport system permease protein n=1 Tax=Antiquaquibacter oligotrophicus TaxID=2880260 RepID=A0ABT6KK45_9MICO|nr:ABC transporter permease [Antiquaquibacter oligotrophicus]MDH6180382.1 oligopeptide transport system permease protein [Antiquaquibacter oligotrophicus]UDF13876.1 ABC transporter permease [Antiquaquibacter oligotrophicus]